MKAPSFGEMIARGLIAAAFESATTDEISTALNKELGTNIDFTVMEKPMLLSVVQGLARLGRDDLLAFLDALKRRVLEAGKP